MSFLVREIVINLFELREGHFLFMENAPPGDDEVRLPERTPELLLQGLKRTEEVERMRGALPLEARVSAGPDAERFIPEAVRTALVAGSTLGALRDAFAHNEHAFLSWAQGAIASGSLRVQPSREETNLSPERSGPALPTAAELYTETIRAVCAAMREAGSLSELRAFFREPVAGMDAAFRGVELGPNGELEVARIMENCGGSQTPRGRAEAYEALDAFLTYALFSARNSVAPERADALVKMVRRLRRERPA
ncbi:MAG TPA: hypothetical protein VEY30_01565, partial [Myxococcaceae bacterium]|nr:hypothetical protein [Myxococcaceae bacterium]